MKLHVLGIDLGKTSFHLVGLDSAGSVVIRRKCSRKQFRPFGDFPMYSYRITHIVFAI
jgi:transposase